MAEIGDMVSFASGLVLLFMSALVMNAYSVRKWKEQSAARYLAVAIWIGFAAAAGNTLYWQVFGQTAVGLGLITVETQRFWGDWLDAVFKGGGALAAYLHLKALHETLPEEDRERWGVLEVAFYPKRRLFLELVTRVLKGRVK